MLFITRGYLLPKESVIAIYCVTIDTANLNCLSSCHIFTEILQKFFQTIYA
jgi:hypothetical protein